MKLRVVTPTNIFVDSDVDELSAPGLKGELGVLPQHTTFLGGLDVGVLQYTEAGSPKKLVVEGGYIEVLEDVVTVLADGAARPEDIDAGEARAELTEVGNALNAVKDDPDEVARLLQVQRRAEARVSVLG